MSTKIMFNNDDFNIDLKNAKSEDEIAEIIKNTVKNQVEIFTKRWTVAWGGIENVFVVDTPKIIQKVSIEKEIDFSTITNIAGNVFNTVVSCIGVNPSIVSNLSKLFESIMQSLNSYQKSSLSVDFEEYYDNENLKLANKISLLVNCTGSYEATGKCKKKIYVLFYMVVQIVRNEYKIVYISKEEKFKSGICLDSESKKQTIVPVHGWDGFDINMKIKENDVSFEI